MRGKHTCNFFLVSRTLASASLAPMPRVFPRKRTSSTSSFSFSPLICGSMSSAVSSFRLLPSSEKILESDMVSSPRQRRFGMLAQVIFHGNERLAGCRRIRAAGDAGLLCKN